MGKDSRVEEFFPDDEHLSDTPDLYRHDRCLTHPDIVAEGAESLLHSPGILPESRPPFGLLFEDLQGCEHSGDRCWWHTRAEEDRKSTRLNSSHVAISYAVFWWKKTK